MILRKIVSDCEQLVANTKKPVVVFDLDHTLFDNGPRSLAIFKEFAVTNRHVSLEKAIDSWEAGKIVPFFVRNVLEGFDVADAATIDAAMDHWWARFFTDHYQKYDVPIEGAANYCQKVYQLGAQVVYLSGRNAPNMLVGCADSLRTHGFPIGTPKTHLVLKPDFDMSDLIFKKEAAEYIDGLGHVVASFDNEPENCNFFLNFWPKAYSIWMATTHMPGAPELSAGVHKIPHFI